MKMYVISSYSFRSLILGFYQVGTIMRYLLDELMSYEEGFTDILMEDRASDRHETFMGEYSSPRVSERCNTSEFVRRDDLREFQQNLTQSLITLFTPTHTHRSFVHPQSEETINGNSNYLTPISYRAYIKFIIGGFK